jgi:dimethylaniline monooxygenase (N-oxide forming)
MNTSSDLHRSTRTDRDPNAPESNIKFISVFLGWSTSRTNNKMKVCIVGGGVAGLQVADALSATGHDCYLFEKQGVVGGVWRENYDGYALQVPAELYQLPGFAPIGPDGTFVDGHTVQAYLERFCRERRLHERCHLHLSEVVQHLEQKDMGSWVVSTSEAAYAFDYCVICTGMYHVPYIPAELSRFNPVHTSEFVDASIVSGCSVTVVGGGKSAIDCAIAASRHAVHVRLVQRQLHWPVPRYILGVLPFKWCTYSRLGHALLPMHWAISATERVWHVFLQPFKYIVWRLMELFFCMQFDIAYDEYKNMQRIEVDLFNGGQILTPDLGDARQTARITRIIGPHAEDLIEHGDVVICGTGFTKDYGIFDANTREALDVKADGLWLYKNMLPPRVPTLAFVGSEVSTFNNVLTFHLQSRWLAQHLSPTSPSTLPTNASMLAYVECEQRWKRRWMHPSPSRAALLQLHMLKYHDILMDDMGLPRVKHRWWQWVLPHHGRDFSVC